MVSRLRKKHLGQHFLTNPTTAQRIVSFLKNAEVPVIEIGPGAGVLTESLLERPVERLILIEKDTDLIPELQTRFGHRVTYCIGDALDVFSEAISQLDHSAVVSNLPYNISAPLTFLFCNHAERISEMVLMYQKEVAEKLTREPGPLRLAVYPFFTVTEKMKLKPASFSPPPKVDSAVVHFQRREDMLVQPEKAYFTFCRLIFENRRKVLHKTIERMSSQSASRSLMTALGLDTLTRVDELNDQSLLDLYKELQLYELHL